MENYILTLTRNQEGGFEVHIKQYDGTLEQLHKETKARTVMIYKAWQYLWMISTPSDELKDVLIVCDDDGKLLNKPITLPILDTKMEYVDCFVGDLCFIAELGDNGDDRGLTRQEAETLIKRLDAYVNLFDALPKIERTMWY